MTAGTAKEKKNAVKRAVLSNGLRVIWEKMPAVRSVAVGVWFDVGVVDEVPATNGVSHLLEHLVFRGTETRDSVEISRAMDEVGGVLDGFTDHENTMYYARVLDEHVELSLDLLSDITINARLVPEDVEKEKRVVKEEIRSYEDSPSDRIHDVIGANLSPTIFSGCRYWARPKLWPLCPGTPSPITGTRGTAPAVRYSAPRGTSKAMSSSSWPRGTSGE